ncbi:MAG: N6-L-threonylcarbamoyladenine synthase [Rhodothermales bacterium]|jgi:N6-L-threonylcarbamoyladenine synthase
MLVLGIETSCDETAVALVESGHDVRANVVSSQIPKHAEYGGVIPELAAREHLRAMTPVVDMALEKAGASMDDVGGIAVTHTPGLLPALLVGLSYGKGLAAARKIPFIGINHIMAHVYGAFIEAESALRSLETYPTLALIVSGGHSMLVLIDAKGKCQTLGQTLDDAAGEAFDKAARVIGLGYPGGPVMDRLAKRGDRKAHAFPRGLMGAGGTPLTPENRYNFSFSGVKTSLLHRVRELTPLPETLPESELPQEWLDMIASYQEAIVDALVRKSMWAVKAFGVRSLVLCGGVACNSRLREALGEAANSANCRLHIAPPKYCTDNGAMIAGLAWHYLRRGVSHEYDLDAIPRMPPFTTVPFTPQG